MTERHPRTIKIPLSPPFSKGDNYTSLWQREAGRDFKTLSSKQYEGQLVLLFYSSIPIPPLKKGSDGDRMTCKKGDERTNDLSDREIIQLWMESEGGGSPCRPIMFTGQ